MNRPDQYIAQLTAQAAWLRAQGDDEGAALAEELADRFNTEHEGVLDVTTPEWANDPASEVVDAAPAIRCWPSTGVLIRGPEGLVLTVDPGDGGDVSVVHLGDVARYLEDGVRAAGEAEAADDRERQAGDAEVATDADAHLAREDDHRDYHARLLASAETDKATKEDDDAFARFNAARAASIPDEMSLLDEDGEDDEP